MRPDVAIDAFTFAPVVLGGFAFLLLFALRHPHPLSLADSLGFGSIA